MRNNIRQWVIGISLACAVGVGGGCAKVPPCTVSPIDIEETREDVKVLQKDLAAARARAKELREELAAKQAEHASKKDKPDELRKKLDDLKKGSGRDESQKRKKKDDDKESA